MNENKESALTSIRIDRETQFKLWFLMDYLSKNDVIKDNTQSESIRYSIDYLYKTICKMNGIAVP